MTQPFLREYIAEFEESQCQNKKIPCAYFRCNQLDENSSNRLKKEKE